MGLVSTETDDDFEDDNITVPQDYYWARYKSANTYVNDDGEHRVALQFEFEYTDEDGETHTVTVPFFAPAKVSAYSRSSKEIGSSKLGGVMEDTGLIQIFDEMVGAEGSIVNGESKYVVESEDEHEDFKNALFSTFDGKEFRLNVETYTDDDGNEQNSVTDIADMREVEDDSTSGSDVETSDEENEPSEKSGEDDDDDVDVLFGEDGVDDSETGVEA